jgi:putative membrane protein
MKRLTIDLLVAGTLAIAPLASAQDYGGTMPNGTGSMQNRNDVSPSAPRPGQPPDTTRGTGTVQPGETTRTPTEVPPPPGMPTPSTTSPSLPSPGAETRRATELERSVEGDLAIARKVHEANQKEIEIGQLAADKAKSQRVKAYARKLVSDHKAMDRQLMSWASKKGLDTELQQVAAMPSPQAGGNDMMARLRGETGSEFDQDFMATMVDEHDKAIEMVRAGRDSAQDPELRRLLDAALPKLERHRKDAQAIVDKLKA